MVNQDDERNIKLVELAVLYHVPMTHYYVYILEHPS